MFSFSKGRQKRCRIAIVLLEEKMKQTSFKGKTTKTLQLLRDENYSNKTNNRQPAQWFGCLCVYALQM